MKVGTRSNDIESPIVPLLWPWLDVIQGVLWHHTYKISLTLVVFRRTFIKVSYLNVSQVLFDRRKGEQRPPDESEYIKSDDLCRPRD